MKPASFSQALPNTLTTFDMVFVAGNMDGKPFMMGDEKGDLWNACRPVHPVRVSDFYMGRYPVTQALWRAVALAEVAGFEKKLEPEPSFFSGDMRPVEWVSWDEARDFIKKLNLLTAATRPAGHENHAYRLPTEAEWEYAACSGQRSRGHLYAGSNKLKEVGWHKTNSHGETKPVGLLLPNELGLYDMSGNVWEWCEDDWHDNYTGAPEEGKAWVEQPERGTHRVNRGGSWHTDTHRCCVTNRDFDGLDYRISNLGFRLAFALQSMGGMPRHSPRPPEGGVFMQKLNRT